MHKYLILTDDRQTLGHFTKWAEVSKNNLAFLKDLIDYFGKCNHPDDFIIYDTEKNEAYKLTNCKIIGGDKH